MEIFYVFAGLTILGLAGYGLQIWSVRVTLKEQVIGNRSWVMGEKDYRLSPVTYSPSPVFPVSILKPLKGLDDNLFDNLESFCRQDYPEYEIVFSLQDYNDSAYKIAKKIKGKYPDRNISIITERCSEGLNPKVNNLMSAYKAARHEHILISDSNVIVERNYLREIMRHMKDENAGLVSNIIRGAGGRSIGSIFENLHLNSFVVGSVCFLDRFLKMPCVVGKSMLMKKKDLEAIGGLKSVKDVLAEDYIIGKKMQKRGKKVILSNHLINNVNEYWGFKKFINRHTRWGKLRWKIGGIRYFSELIGNPVFMSCFPILLWEPTRVTLCFAAIVSFIKILGDYYLGRIIGSGGMETRRSGENDPPVRQFTHSPVHYLLSPIKDLIIGIIWFVPVLSNTVVWRGNRYIIGKDSMLSQYPENGIWSWRYRLADSIRARLA